MSDERENPLSSPDTSMLRFFEDRESGEIGVGEHDRPFLFGDPTACAVKDRSHHRTRHRVAVAHDVDSRDARPNVRMRTFEVVHDGVPPVRPVPRQQHLAHLGGSPLGESPVESPHHGPIKLPGLVVRDNIPQRR